MKRIALLGGMSWESSIEYERVINTAVRERLGGAHSADLLVRSYDFDAIESMQQHGEWDAMGELLAGDARRLQDAGGELLVICTNTMHVLAPQIEAAIDIPLLHIADATADAVHAAGIRTVALLGTRYTMEMGFYRDRLAETGITALIPDEPDRTLVHDVIYDELVRGIVSPESRAEYLRIIEELVERGAEGVVSGCTEIELLVRESDLDVPLFPTAKLHALAAVDAALAE
ncbi:MAG: aspartate/glutamate racemase family protein [Coriobacteriia bacterium]|nr:aspartate/glutamate racemase family protein [Coriobacteriia bacterium]